MWIAVGRAHTRFPGQEAKAPHGNALFVSEAAFIESPVSVAEFPRELNVGGIVFELAVIARARPIVLVGLLVDDRVAKHSLRRVALVIYELYIATLGRCAVGLTQTELGRGLRLRDARGLYAGG